MGRDSGGIWFRSPTPVVFQTQPVNTLDELNSVVLRHMGVIGGDQHVRGMFELHRKYGPGQIMELLAETQTVSSEAGGSSSSAVGGTDVIPCSPIHVAAPEAAMQLDGNCEEDSDEDFVGDDGDTSESSDGSEFVPESQCRRDFILPAPAPIPDLSSVSSHFHTLYLDDMAEVPREGIGGGGDDYDVQGGLEFRVGHRFSTRKTVQMAVKNYSIRRAAEYRVVESDPHKYVCRCKLSALRCPWSIRVALRTNLGYWYVAIYY
ncbi:hypothetical protein PIB30_108573 [Stylosanthes scabra]|uniref:Transposase MuDR plant domain-containing protein n=2 Tax=Stylosanthes scabra TaxID=79078 RepID=A0ABU6Z188_9FABA|nr:hypothetical protein [Stylosanthes scabra]